MSKPSTQFHAIVPAAGSGQRFGGDVPKQFLTVAGRPLLAWTVERLLEAGALSVTVSVPLTELETARSLFEDSRVLCVAGGSSRQDSVAIALAACPADSEELVAVHDGARPVVGLADIGACLEAAATADGAILGRPVSDTIKLVVAGVIEQTVDRRLLFRAETPQVFERELLERGLDQAREQGFDGTDEASIVERIPGVRLVAVAAESPNPKLTTPDELPVVEMLIRDTIGAED